MLADPNNGILKKGREVVLTGCHLRISTGGSARLIPREYFIILLDEVFKLLTRAWLRPQNGGLISLEELCKLLSQRRRGSRETVSEDDWLRAISKLKVLSFVIRRMHFALSCF